jgi:hypothetical protein
MSRQYIQRYSEEGESPVRLVLDIGIHLGMCRHLGVPEVMLPT